MGLRNEVAAPAAHGLLRSYDALGGATSRGTAPLVGVRTLIERRLFSIAVQPANALDQKDGIQRLHIFLVDQDYPEPPRCRPPNRLVRTCVVELVLLAGALRSKPPVQATV